MMKYYLLLGCLLAGTAVILGAFAAHGLKDRVDTAMLAVFQTGVQYQLYHALALIIVALMAKVWPQMPLLFWVAGLFVAGVLLFSGSLYILALGGSKIFGPITPLGGLCFILGWLTLVLAVLKIEN